MNTMSATAGLAIAMRVRGLARLHQLGPPHDDVDLGLGVLDELEQLAHLTRHLARGPGGPGDGRPVGDQPGGVRGGLAAPRAEPPAPGRPAGAGGTGSIGMTRGGSGVGGTTGISARGGVLDVRRQFGELLQGRRRDARRSDLLRRQSRRRQHDREHESVTDPSEKGRPPSGNGSRVGEWIGHGGVTSGWGVNTLDFLERVGIRVPARFTSNALRLMGRDDYGVRSVLAGYAGFNRLRTGES